MESHLSKICVLKKKKKKNLCTVYGEMLWPAPSFVQFNTSWAKLRACSVPSSELNIVDKNK